MRNKIVFTVLLLLSLDANAALGDGDKIDFLPIPGEFCNADSDNTHVNCLGNIQMMKASLIFMRSILGYVVWSTMAALQNKLRVFIGQCNATS